MFGSRGSRKDQADHDNEAMVKACQMIFDDRNTINIRAHDIAQDLLIDKQKNPTAPEQIVMNFEALPKVVPPFRGMWIEAEFMGARTGFLTIREPHPEIEGWWFVVVLAFKERRGVPVGPYLPCGMYIDGEGKVQNVMVDDNSEFAALARLHCYFVAETIARMNCQNIEVVPVPVGKVRAKKQPHEERNGIVWHEIRIRSDERFQQRTIAVGMGSGDGEDPDQLIRAHWVRGHFADYRQGRGLFGRWKVLLWVPEHRRGNEAKGETIVGYRVT